MSAQTVFGQHRGNPIRPYNENGYTVPQVKSFVFEKTTLSTNYRVKMLELINNGLEESGENIRVTENNLRWILDNCIFYKEKVLDNFINTMSVGDNIETYPDKNFRGTVGVFQYGKCRLVLFKTICMNLLEVPVELVSLALPPKLKFETPPVGPDDGWRRYKQPTQPDLNLPEPKKAPKKKIKIWFIVIPVAAIITGVAIYLKNKKHGTTIEPRSMPGGIPATPVPTPGLPADPRTMPGG